MTLRRRDRFLAIAALVAALAAPRPSAAVVAAPLDLKFSFGPAPVPGFQPVRPGDAYDDQRGYGFDLGSQVTVVDRGGAEPLRDGFVTGRDGRPFFFSVKLAPGAYRVTVTLGDAAAASTTTVKSETRRLMAEAVHTAAGEWTTRTFLVHLRVPQIPGGGTVSLKPREREPILYVQWDEQTRLPFLELDWDDKLTLEFSDAHPALCTVEIAPAEHPRTVYLIGDSTVTDQMMEPWAAWGQMLPRWFRPPVMIANYAESGETTASFISEHRWAKVLSEIHPGDYVLMQFGINDQRMPVERFKEYFLQYIRETREHGATPVLVTSQNLRRLDADGHAVETLRNFPEAMREAAQAEHAALVDLNAMSMQFYAALGPALLPKAFVDGTHQDDYGAYELAKCVVQGLLDAQVPFAVGQVVADWQPFDPAHPDPMADFKLPPDPQLDPARPGGPGAPGHRGPMAGDVPRPRPAPPKPTVPPAGTGN